TTPRIAGIMPTPFRPDSVAYDPANASIAVLGESAVAFLDPTTGAVIANVSLPAAGGLEQGVQILYDAASSDLFALVAPQVVYGVGTLYEFSGLTHALLRNVSLAYGSPIAIALDPEGGRVFVAGGSTGNLTIYDTSSLTLVKTIAVPGSFGPGNPTSAAFNPARDQIYVTEETNDVVDVYNGSTYALNASYAAPEFPQGMLYDAANDTLYVAAPNAGALHVFEHPVGPLITAFSARPSGVSVGSITTLVVSATGGSAPLAFSYAGLPAGCRSTNAPTDPCYPTAAGTFTVTVTVRDSSGLSEAAALVLIVTPASTSGSMFLVTFFIAPASCGPLTAGGLTYPNDSGGRFAAGQFGLAYPSCPGRPSAFVTGSGNVTANTTLMLVTGNGSVTLRYEAAGVFQVTVLVSPASCGRAVTLNGTSYTANGTALFMAGSYPISAGPCNGATFSGWQTTTNLSVAAGLLHVAGNGSVTAEYAIVPGGGGTPGGGTLPDGISPLDLGIMGGAVVVAVIVGLLLLRRRRSPPAQSPSADGAPGPGAADGDGSNLP
ncbi:MAG: hypothetical protein L3J91_02070, partial [Thermoplasmata archaeon]|nr:hypothetical protein [Thermoplasmata archaeon]